MSNIITQKSTYEQLQIGDKIFVLSYKLPKTIVGKSNQSVIVKHGKGTIRVCYKSYDRIVTSTSDILR